jgi:hypothetical protein
MRPKLSVEVAYRGFTTAGEQRHASLKGRETTNRNQPQ